MDENTIAYTAVLCKTLHENTNEFLIFFFFVEFI